MDPGVPIFTAHTKVAITLRTRSRVRRRSACRWCTVGVEVLVRVAVLVGGDLVVEVQVGVDRGGITVLGLVRSEERRVGKECRL